MVITKKELGSFCVFSVAAVDLPVESDLFSVVDLFLHSRLLLYRLIILHRSEFVLWLTELKNHRAQSDCWYLKWFLSRKEAAGFSPSCYI